MKKHSWIIALTLLLGTLLILCLEHDRDRNTAEAAAPIAFTVCSGETDETVNIWENDGEYYVFLPSFAELDKTNVLLNDTSVVFLDDTRLYSGMGCGVFELNRDYELSVGSTAPVRFRFLRSANVAAMFVHTASGSMDEVHRDKTHRERCDIVILSQTGELAYRTVLADGIRGHGNSTWELEKKSYNIYLGRDADLFGMGEAEKYILVSNAIDDTNLRNRLVYDFAGRVSPYEGFSPECEFTDLYLNGEYVGLYLLCEKPEIHRSRLNLEPGSTLFEITAYGGEGRQFFEFNDSVFVEIHDPDPCFDKYREHLEARLRSLQASLLSSPAGSQSYGQNWQDTIDLDSWARKYLIEEIFENSDVNFFSQYYFCTSADGRICAGPCWDYDGTMGMFEYFPNCFLAQRDHLNTTLYQPLNAALWQQEEFRLCVTELYRTEFLPELARLLDITLPEMTLRLETASELNRLRWFSATESVADSVRDLETYLRAHLDFLNSAWIDGVPYGTLTLKRSPGSNYLYFSVPLGSPCPDLPEPYELDAEGDTWYKEDSGEIFDRGDPVTSDLILTAYPPLVSDQRREADAA